MATTTNSPMHTLTPLKAQIFQAAVDIHASGRTVTRITLAEHTSLKFSVIDEHVKWLCDRSVLRRVVNGVLEPAETFPGDRPISKTVLAEGWVKVEAGEEMMTLTPGEARKLGLALYGDAMEFAHIKGERDTYDTVHGLRQQLRSMEKRLGDTMRALAQIEQSRKADLFSEQPA